ncbi:MAG: glutathione peroxidase [Deltaproteobacteria bacterium HGW-Deltaproteobacteria-14]|jgi:glutathione peroxidase|nr:MAG: glutathione peroxidase [Deltaproteobacteria bacterium HGW-Deltaproteobacteria-14]
MATLDYETKVTTLGGEERDLSEHRGKVMLVVNTASKCGFTPQYDGLEALWKKHRDEGLVVLGFPCNQFGHQEPGSAEDIEQFCRLNHGVTFPLHAKIDVNGKHTHPLFEQLKAGAPGILGSKGIKWNFTKFLVGRDGAILKRYAPKDTPESIDGELSELLRG